MNKLSRELLGTVVCRGACRDMDAACNPLLSLLSVFFGGVPWSVDVAIRAATGTHV
jgi:hypothetical protein